MRWLVLFIGSLVVSAVVLATGFLIKSSREVSAMAAQMQDKALQDFSNLDESYQILRAKAIDRSLLYNDLILKDHVFFGMVVNRSSDGTIRGECDSLLFSSLRYVALRKLKLEDEAYLAWQSIEQTQNNGLWYRHPRCRRRWTSRDMIVGLMAALSQKPEGHKTYLRELLNYIDNSHGYIGKGPFYVSKMTPGIGELLRHMAKDFDISPQDLPDQVKYAYSTIEFDSLAGKRGYTSHLNALILWIELEMALQKDGLRTFASMIDSILEPFTGKSLEQQRIQWVAKSLVNLDRENLFFQYLLLRSTDSLTKLSKTKLLAKLLAMPQFPEGRLPSNCDRKADYLWQRDSVEYSIIGDSRCNEIFHGVDFIWLASLLI